MTYRQNRWSLPCWVGVLLVVLQPTAQAAWVVDPSARLEVSYEDNIRLVDDDKEDALITSATAQTRLRNVTERSQISGVVGLGYQNYSGVDDLDDQTVGFLDISANRRAERASYGLRTSLRSDVILRTAREIPEEFSVEDPDSAQEGEVDDPTGELGDQLAELGPDIDENVLQEQIEREQIIASPFFAYQLSERSEARVGYSFFGLRYDDDGTNAGLRDSNNHTVFAQLSRDVSELTAVSLRLQASRFEPDASIESDNYQATVGWQRELSPRASIGIDLGARRVESDLNNDTGFVFALRGSFDTQRGEISGSVQRSILPSAFGDVVEADRLELTYQRALSERATFSLNARGFATRRDGGTSDRDRSFVTLTPQISWNMSPAWDVGLGYTYRWTDRESDLGAAAGNAVNLSLVYRPPSRL